MATKVWKGDNTGNEGDYATAANWSPSGVPIATDDVFFKNSDEAVTAGLNQSAVALTSITFEASYTAAVGTETTFLQVAATTATINNNVGPGTPQGSSRLNLDFGTTTAVAIEVQKGSLTALDTNRSPIRLLANNASTTIHVKGGQVSIMSDPDETGTISSLDVLGGEVIVGAGVTVTTINVNGGSLSLNSGVTTLNIQAGTVTTEGSGAITTVNITGGTLHSNSTGTTTTVNVDDGRINFLGSQLARTVTNMNLGLDGRIDIDKDDVTLTNDIVLNTTQAVTIEATL